MSGQKTISIACQSCGKSMRNPSTNLSTQGFICPRCFSQHIRKKLILELLLTFALALAAATILVHFAGILKIG